jgi:hypothetical protein
MRPTTATAASRPHLPRPLPSPSWCPLPIPAPIESALEWI